MTSEVLERMSGEELLLLRALDGVAREIDAELDRRSLHGIAPAARRERFWAGRLFANRHSARVTSAA